MNQVKIVKLLKINIKKRVAVEHYEMFALQFGCRLSYGSAGKERCVFVRVDDFRLAVMSAEPSFDKLVLVACSEHDMLNAGLHQPIKHITQERLAVNRRHRLGYVADHMAQTRPESAC